MFKLRVKHLGTTSGFKRDILLFLFIGIEIDEGIEVNTLINLHVMKVHLNKLENVLRLIGRIKNKNL